MEKSEYFADEASRQLGTNVRVGDLIQVGQVAFLAIAMGIYSEIGYLTPEPTDHQVFLVKVPKAQAA